MWGPISCLIRYLLSCNSVIFSFSYLNLGLLHPLAGLPTCCFRSEPFGSRHEMFSEIASATFLSLPFCDCCRRIRYTLCADAS